ncbi:PVC-type heme-binding CxxCH protein [Pedosphaera parvula]|uniref:Membrane-bound dehydrogenase domain protein n=1 Tax=Pedosphaera parvula (strain Ellin514) TaxID=320771 RepID=B9XA82_PEDPL|nr:PVC-type heme-binding CxxCH protein [Pedosphaera parvula]EEF63423.1 membrane-bound dehydrogenase domain protein [Pedosphaera parvula Ellin514]
MLLRTLIPCLFLASAVYAQQGDRPGEVQNQPAFPIPPAPVLSADEALKTFKLAPGFKIQLVASEPLVQDPVAIAFDPDGRLWVVEMRGYMPNVDGSGEGEQKGRIVILEDTDGDGKMDKSTVFADDLFLPRAIALVRGGALVAESPKLWFLRDTNGDGKADERIEVAKDYGNRNSPEHDANGLLWGLDNWIYSANFTTRYRSLEEDWKKGPTAFRGQWGISQDDFGRLFFNANEDQLRCDLVPSAYLYRNPNYRTPMGINFQAIKEQSVWPVRVNPGVNRGYRPGQLRTNGTLATFTAACSPLVYRGNNFPAEFHGNVFVCEPAGNLVHRDILEEKDGVINAKRAYENSEFLASSDERFRPVNLSVGPDGALYVVDMYRGVLQHRIFVTSYLRQQILSRGLEKPVDKGRIYRVAHEGTPLDAKPHLAKASSTELVQYLSHANAWYRETAQRLLVERNDASVASELKKLATNATNPVTRVHALWTLDGIGQLDEQTLLAQLKCQYPKVRATAIRLMEPLFKSEDRAEVLTRLSEAVTNDKDADVQIQLALTLGEVADPVAEQEMLEIAKQSSGIPLVREALISGLVVHELEFTEKLLADKSWEQKQPGREEMLRSLAQCVFTEGKTKRIEQLLGLVAKQNETFAWRQLALLDGMTTSAPAKGKGKSVVRVKRIKFAAEPAALAALSKSGDAKLRDRVEKLAELITWPGQPGYEPDPPVVPLTEAQLVLFNSGKTLFEGTCAQCHQPHGLGQEGLAPPLVDSEWVLGPDKRLARIALNGVHGPLNVKGRKYEMDMPAFGSAFTDDQVAAILTYIRRSWDHSASAVTPDTVKAVRTETAKREEAWSESELLKVR